MFPFKATQLMGTILIKRMLRRREDPRIGETFNQLTGSESLDTIYNKHAHVSMEIQQEICFYF